MTPEEMLETVDPHLAILTDPASDSNAWSTAAMDIVSVATDSASGYMLATGLAGVIDAMIRYLHDALGVPVPTSAFDPETREEAEAFISAASWLQNKLNGHDTVDAFTEIEGRGSKFLGIFFFFLVSSIRQFATEIAYQEKIQ